ncbi:MAG: hypothetical protein HRT70_05560 [Flavobacteriaceae bacterium]|nr:hypothetical protein [Flavobacteriaceae bacterium]
MRKFTFTRESIALGIIFIFYILFPNNNSSLDAFGYAGYVEYNKYLFKPHHLLSHAFLYGLIAPFKAMGWFTDTILFGKVINSIFQIINLIVFNRILILLNIPTKQRILFLLTIGFSFNLWQYGVENEVYIIPITFSLLGSFYFLKSLINKNYFFVVISGLFTAFSCLFHQLHFFWWLGLLIGVFLHNKNIKSLIFYTTPALVVPLGYAFVLIFYQNQELTISNLYYFMMHDFYQEGIAKVSYSWHGWKSILFQSVSTIRIFLEAHPNIFVLLKTNWLYFVPLLISLVIGIQLIWQFFKKEKMFEKRENNRELFANIHLFILIAVYLFAFYSYGNVEFMVALPFLIFLFIGVKFHINQQFLKQFILLLFVWNFSFGIFPDYYYRYYDDQKLVDYIIKNDDKTFLVKSYEIQNKYFYKKGVNPINVLYFGKVSKDSILSILEHKAIYTDIIDKPEVFNRAKIHAMGSEVFTFEEYTKENVYSYKGLYGTSRVYKILKN